MKKIHFDPRRLDLAKHAFIHSGRYANYLRQNVYGRHGLLKVFDIEPVETIEDFKKVHWGDEPPVGHPHVNTNLFEAIQIQNILSWHGLSTKVYGLEAVKLANKIYPAQYIEPANGMDATPSEAQNIYFQAVELGKKYGFGIEKEDVSAQDVIGGKLIDLQTFRFISSYEQFVKNTYLLNKYGEGGYYQDVPEFAFHTGPRKSLDRIKYLGLERINFEGKTVVDVGCSGGFFGRYAVDHGALYADGFDFLDQVEVARNVANLFGYWNSNFYPLDLRTDEWSVKDYDIVFYLSMNFHIGIPQQILDAKMVIFEDNGRETRHLETLGSPWTENFKRIEYIGRAADHGDKAIYHLYK